MPDPLLALSPRQRGLLDRWLPGFTVEADLSWGLVETTVLKVTRGARTLVVKAGGPSDTHLAREIHAHRTWTSPWTATGRASRLLHADPEAKLLVTTYLPGRLVLDDPAAAHPDTYAQAGALLAGFHAQYSAVDPDHEPRMNAKALAWLDGPHRIPADTAARLRALIRSWPTPPARLVPTHGDWQTRNWLIGEDGLIRVIDFGRTALRPAAEDLERLAGREFLRHPDAEPAFLAAYGPDPRDPDTWFRQRLRAAIGTAGWAHRIGDTAYETEGLQLITALLEETNEP